VLNVLRQMSIEELRYAAAACSPGVDPSPEGIIRALCRECMVLGWGFVPLSREDALLEQVGQRLGVPSSPKGPQGIAVAERRVFRALLRHAWEAADPSYQQRILEEAAGLWDGGDASRPELPSHATDTGLRSAQLTGARAALEGFLAHPAGLRALAAATEVVPLVFPRSPFAPLTEPLSAAVGSLTGIRPRPDRGHPALFEVLTLCWRARRRLLVERRLQQQQIERQLRQLDVSMQRRAEELRGASSPWARHWVGGLSVAGGAAAAAYAQLLMGVPDPAGWIAVGAGLAWSAVVWAVQPRAESDPRYARMLRERTALRQQLFAVQQSIAALDAS